MTVTIGLILAVCFFNALRILPQFIDQPFLSFLVFVCILLGTLSASFIHWRLSIWRETWLKLSALLWGVHSVIGPTAIKLIRLSQLARRDGVLSLDAESTKESNAFLRLALQLIVDGNDAQRVRQTLFVAIETEAASIQMVLEFIRFFGRYIALASLMVVMVLFFSDASFVVDGESISAVLINIALYGVGLALLVAYPLAGRLQDQAKALKRHHEMVVDGILSILSGENTRLLERRLSQY